MNLSSERKQRLWLSSGAGALLVLALVALTNVAGQYAFLRLDFSAGRLYSIGSASRKILRSLPDPVLVKVYYSKELPPQVLVNLRYLQDLLKEYRTASGGKVRTRAIEIGDDPKNREEAVSGGVVPVQLDILSRDKYEQREGFLGLVLQYQDKKDVVPFLKDTNGLEYELTSRIKSLSASHKPLLGFVSGNEKTSVNDGNLGEEARASLSQHYDLRGINLDQVSIDSGVASDFSALMVLGPQLKMTDKALFLLDQFLLRGGSLGVAVDTKRTDTRAFMASDMDSGMLPFLQHHGFDVQSTMVFDAQSQPIQVAVQQGIFKITNIVQYPPMVLSTTLNREHPVTKSLNSVILPFVSPMMVSTGPAFGTVEALAQSSKFSWARPPGKAHFMMLSPLQFSGPEADDLKGPFVLAAARVGKFTPFFERPPASLSAKNFLTQAQASGRLLVVGTSAAFKTDYRGPTGDAFFLNMADWLEQDTDLIAIRSKAVSFSALREISPVAKQVIRWIDILLPPLLAVFGGFVMWRRRKRLAIVAQMEYGRSEPSPSVPKARIRESSVA